MPFVPDAQQTPRFVPDEVKPTSRAYTGPTVEEYPQWASTGGGAAVGRPRMMNRTNVQPTPRPLESTLAGVTKSAIDPLIAGAQLVTGGNLGTSQLAQRLDKEADVYSQANPIAYGTGRVAGAVLPAAGITKGVGMIPSFAKANPLAQGAGIGAVSGLTTPINTGETGPEMYGDVAKNVALGTAIGTAIPAVGAIPSMMRGKPPAPQIQQAAQEARDLGYVIPPTQVNPSLLNRTMEGFAGKISTAQNASARNQEITNKLTAKSLGLPEDTVITSDLLQNIRNQAGQAYENLGASGVVKTSPKYIQALDNIEPYKDAKKAVAAFNSPEAQPIIDVIDSLKTKSFDVSAALSKIKLLRNDADKAYRLGDSSLGKANKQAAEVLENTIENHLANTKQTDLLSKFRDARQLIAKTYSIQKAANTTTGTIDAKKLAAQLQKGKPLSGELKSIAEFSQAFPKATQTTESMGSLAQISPLDLALGLVGGIGTGGPGAGVVLARPALRAAALSEPVQNRLIQSTAQPYLTQQQRNLAKLLTLQGIQGATNE
jgi:hypothetical protein